MRRAVLTGGTGFVGANLARRLLHDGHEVHLLVQRGHSTWRIEAIRESLRLHEVDLADRASLEGALRVIRPEWVFHLAAYGGSSWQTDWRRMVETNLFGTVNLLDAAQGGGFEAFVHSGSSSEYGLKDHAPAEDEAIEPNSDYAVTKAAATLHCRHVARTRGANVVTLRLYSAYGPYEHPKRLIPTLIMRGLHGELPELVNPAVARDYVHVDDVCEAFLRAASTSSLEPGAVYNIGTGVQTSLRDVVDVARRALRLSVEPQWGTMANRDWDTTTWVADNRKAATRLGWRPRYGLVDGLEAVIRWFRENPALQSWYRAQ